MVCDVCVTLTNELTDALQELTREVTGLGSLAGQGQPEAFANQALVVEQTRAHYESVRALLDQHKCLSHRVQAARSG